MQRLALEDEHEQLRAGYMSEHKVAGDYVDVRVRTVFGGTTEIMTEIIGRDLGL